MKYIEEEGRVVTKNSLVGIPGYLPEPGEKEKKIIANIKTIMNDRLFTPPGLDEISAISSLPEADLIEIIVYLTDQGELVRINESLYFSRAAIENGQELLAEYFTREKELTLATARDIFDTSRKYALPLIEYYDRTHFTRRVGDIRVKYHPSREKSAEEVHTVQ
jgi:selenocysteine-specific elongation factor